MSNDIWSVILVIAFFGWIGSIIKFIFAAFPGRDRFEVKPARTWGIVFICLFIVWITGLLNA